MSIFDRLFSFLCLALVVFLMQQTHSVAASKHADTVMVVLFENTSFSDLAAAPVFQKFLANAQNKTDAAKQAPGYAVFTQYYNNHSGGLVPTRSSQPNYIALTSGSTHGIVDNLNHDLAVDNLASELMDQGLTWAVYADDLPGVDQRAAFLNPLTAASAQATCFTDASYPSDDGYWRKHEPMISYLPIQKHPAACVNIVNSRYLASDLSKMPNFSLYIPNQIHDGHNGSFTQRIANANAFLAKNLGLDPSTGASIPGASGALFQEFMNQGGLLVLTFDEPSLASESSDRRVLTVLAGQMIQSGFYPDVDRSNQNTCFASLEQQAKRPADRNGAYDPKTCNHYNLLKLIEENFSLRGLNPKATSAGYQSAFPLDFGISEQLWRQ